MKTLIDYGIFLRHKRNGEHKTLCPECSHTRTHNKKDPCLSVKVDGDSAVWNCHHCEFKGSTGRKSDHPKTYTRPSYKPNVLPEKVIKYFADRGISESTLEANKVGFVESHYIAKDGGKVACIQFPFYRDGECVNVKYRSGSKGFGQEANAEQIFCGMDDVPEDSNTLYIVEGEMDKLACNEVGFWNVVSVPSGAPNEDAKDVEKKFEFIGNCVEFLQSFENVIIAVDMDKNGLRLREELARRIGREKCGLIEWPDGCKDANDLLMTQGENALSGALSRPRPYPVEGLYNLKDFLPQILDMYENGIDKGFSTGWQEFDRLYRISGGVLTIVTGYPGSGKSEFIDAMCFNMAVKHGWKFAYCSLENPIEMHGLKFAHRYHSKPPTKECMTREEVEEAVDWTSRYFQFISPGFLEKGTIEWALERATIAVKQNGVKGVVLDPYNRFYVDKPNTLPETDWINQKLEAVLRFCRQYGVHVWFIAHPKKTQSTDIAPGLFDISGSAHWFNATDFGISVHREFDKNTGKRKTQAQVHVKKVRNEFVGEEGYIIFDYDKYTRKYSPLSEQEMQIIQQTNKRKES